MAKGLPGFFTPLISFSPASLEYAHNLKLKLLFKWLIYGGNNLLLVLTWNDVFAEMIFRFLTFCVNDQSIPLFLLLLRPFLSHIWLCRMGFWIASTALGSFGAWNVSP